jgi:predicted alpha/beta-fold hydrolase
MSSSSLKLSEWLRRTINGRSTSGKVCTDSEGPLEYITFGVLLACLVVMDLTCGTTIALVCAIFSGVVLATQPDEPRVPDLQYQRTDTNGRIVSMCPSLHVPFCPTWWAFNGHIQTALMCVWSGGLKNLANSKWHREMVQMDDGGSVAVDWWLNGPNADDTETPIVFLVPGVVGSRENPYFSTMMYDLLNDPVCRRWRVCCKSWRGLGVPLTSPRHETWDGRAVRDLSHCIRWVKSRFPNAPIVAYGISHGATTLAACVGADRGLPLAAAFCSSGPSDYAAQIKMMDVQRPMPYDSAIGCTLIENLTKYHGDEYLANSDAFLKESGVIIDRTKLPKLMSKVGLAIRSLRFMGTIPVSHEFHDEVTCRFDHHGSGQNFVNNTRNELLGMCTSSIRIRAAPCGSTTAPPLMCWYALDDPLHTAEATETVAATMVAANPNCIFVTTPTGGHCGFFTGWRPTSVVTRLAIEFYHAALKSNEPLNIPSDRL